TNTGKSPTFYALDLADKEALRQFFENENIESAIHFAGYKALGESVAKPILFYENNIMSTLALVVLMTEFSFKKLVFSSCA
ncbi:NAD-dependent epimerase/dehydratase family protein, partial [Streptococcus suis]